MKDYGDIHAENINIATQLPENKRIYILNGLPGVGIPVGSTILHFIYPENFPIIDERTIKSLQYFEYLDRDKSVGQLRDNPESYNKYRNTILKIQNDCKEEWNLRQIDKALFAFEKYELNKLQ